MTRKQIFIVRHGETDFNRRNIIQGSGVDTELNEFGLEQAAKFFKRYETHPFNAVYTSSLKRSLQSVKPFIDKGIRHIPLSELNEISWGDFEGRSQSEEQKRLYWDTVNLWKNGFLEAKIPNGETPLQLQERQKIAAKLILEDPGANILVCMHGRAMKSFLCLLLNIPLSRMEEFQHTNLCLYQLEHDGISCKIIRNNETGHLQ